jgi:large subunit ribosomal protein L22
MKEVGSMEVVVYSRYVRMSPSKLRRVIDQIRHRPISEALVILKFLALRPCQIVLKLLNSGIASCKIKSNHDDVSRFYIKEIRVDEGPTLKRFRPHAQGRGFPIKKRMSHIISVV